MIQSMSPDHNKIKLEISKIKLPGKSPSIWILRKTLQKKFNSQNVNQKIFEDNIIDKSPARLTKIKREKTQITIIRNKTRDINLELVDIRRIMRKCHNLYTLI